MTRGETPLDRAHAAMLADPDDDALRLAWYAGLADTELCLLLEIEAKGDRIDPKTFDLDGARFVLGFDSDARLAGFAGGVAPYAALPGRVVAGMLAGQGLGLGVNLGLASAYLMPPEAVDWLAATLAEAPAEVAAVPTAVHAPGDLPPALLATLAARLGGMAGLARSAHLAAVAYQGGRRGHLLAVLGAAPEAEAALAKAVGEALSFSGIEAGEIDVLFLTPGDALAAAVQRLGLRFEIPAAPVLHTAPPTAPGSDPDRPPRLR